MLGINGSEFIALLAVAAVVLGPEQLPKYAQQLAQLIRELRRMATSAQDKVREELGPEFDEVDWRALDPRQYDPRRIVREALSDVVDVNDPLGLKGAGDDPLGIKDVARDPLGLRSRPGGAANGSAAHGTSTPATPQGGAPEPDLPAFDPDAT